MTTRLRLLTRYAMVLVLIVLALGCGEAPPSSTATTPAATGAASAAGPGSRIVDVAANQGWQDTGIRVEPQQKFQLRFRSGKIIDKDVTIADGHGSDFICGDPGCCEPMPDERRGTLLARIAGSVLIVGNGGEFMAAEGGNIFLRINDCDSGLADNSGQLKVEFIP
jgi:hypothetical protein